MKPDLYIRTKDGGIGFYGIETIFDTEYEGQPRLYALLIACLENPNGERASTVLPYEKGKIATGFATREEADFAMALVNGYFREKGEIDSPARG